jgi:hypothetical protein
MVQAQPVIRCAGTQNAHPLALRRQIRELISGVGMRRAEQMVF